MTTNIYLPGRWLVPPRAHRSPTAAGAAPCWVTEADHAWDETIRHHPTLAEAEAATDRESAPEALVYQLEKPCIEVTCQCGAYELGQDEYPAGLHFPAWRSATEYADDLDMAIHDDGWLVFTAEQAWNQHGRHSVGCASLTTAEER